MSLARRLRLSTWRAPVGVHARNFDKSKIKALGWEAETSLRQGIAETYAWIEEQVRKTIDK
jgi:nucleoside-diphosphate-sugar epimerase